MGMINTILIADKWSRESRSKFLFDIVTHRNRVGDANSVVIREVILHIKKL